MAEAKEWKRRPRLRWALAAALCVPGLAFLATEAGAPLPAEINCRSDEVDIRTGRVRHTRYLFFVPIRRRVEDSVLSRALPPAVLSAASPDWHRVNTFRPGSLISVHHRFHGALGQIRTLENLLQSATFTPGATRAVAARILGMWQNSGGDSGVDDYLRALQDLTKDGGRVPGTIDEGDLPPP